jgi:thioredoxin-like negative regulator of GroEL
MKNPARMIVLALAAATQVAAAGERFIPADPHFVVANVKQAMPDAELRGLISRWRDEPGDAASVALGAAFIERARILREPMYMGRAEAVLASAVAQPDSSVSSQTLYAETLQYRHEFAAAEARLDRVLMAAPRDASARLLRASVRLVRGNFAGARADCAQLLAGSGADQWVALACLAESLAGSGQMAQASALLAALPDRSSVPAARAYVLTVRAELLERRADFDHSIADYRAALALAPGDDSIRAALADALLVSGDPRQACALLAIDRPGLALMVRGIACAEGAERERWRSQASAWLDLEKARGDSPHLREAALLALGSDNAASALAAAEANFAVQRELVDVRVLARAARAARDPAASRSLSDWLHHTGFRDVITENMLATVPRG